MSEPTYWDDVNNAPARDTTLDDDAQVLDSLVSPDAEPPTVEDVADAVVTRLERVSIPPLTRMQTATFSLDEGQTFMLAGEDPWRVSLSIGPGGSESGELRIGPSRTEAANPLTSARVYIDAASSTAVSVPHTGAVYAYSASAIAVSVTTVSKENSNV